MAIAAPNLDDRRFQDLVDDAKRMVMDRCPAWTDHNVSDPGVTLIETFAYVTDQLLYRLNRVPDRLYIKFLELIGIRLFPPTAARAGVTFWLSAPATTTLVIPAGTRTATLRGDGDEPVVFSHVARSRDRADRAADRRHARQRRRRHASPIRGARGRHRGARLQRGAGPRRHVARSASTAPHPATRWRSTSTARSTVSASTRPTRRCAWEAWNGIEWEKCELEKDETGGLNRKGDIVVHLPAGHAESLIEGERAGWVRAQVIEAHEGQPPLQLVTA